MRSIQEDVSKSMSELLIRIANILSHKLDSFTSWALVNLANNIEKGKIKGLETASGETKIEKLLTGVENGHSLKNINVPDEDLENFKPFMKQTGVLWATIDLGNDDSKMVCFLDNDVEKMEMAMKLFQANRGLITELQPYEFMVGKEGKDISITNLTAVELELFRHYAKADGAVFAVIPDGENYQVMYESKDKAKIANVLAKSNWDLTGEYGPLIREQVEIRLAGRQAINIAMADAEKEYYIVSGRNPKNYIHVTPKDFTYYKSGKQVAFSERANDEDMTSLKARVAGLSQPVVLTKEEYEMGNVDEIVNSQTALFPAGYTSYNEVLAAHKELEKISLKEKKLSLDNGDQPEMVSDFSNPNVSFSEFFSLEMINDENDKEHMTMVMKKLDEYKTVDTVAPKNGSLDKMLAEANKIADRQATESKREKTQSYNERY